MLCFIADVTAAETDERRRKLVLHIGPHKTGTTAFQSWLEINEGISPTLRYPKVCGSVQHPIWYAHLADSLCGHRTAGRFDQHPLKSCPPTAENFLASVDKGSSNSSDLILSSENFSQCTPDEFAGIKAVFGRAFDVEVVILRRESKSLILSRYHQWHKDMQHTVTFTETLLAKGGKHQHFCSYTSLKCLQGLGHAFGPEKVHVVSYEGLLATGKELAEVVCDVFSASTGCYAAPSKDHGVYRANRSPSHLTYSAAAIFNHFKIIAGCQFPKFNEKDLEFFTEALDKASVPKSCYPLSWISSIDCDTCFHEAMLGNDVTISGMHNYHFMEGAAYIASSDAEVCEYRESAIFKEPRTTFDAVVGAMKRIASSCYGPSTTTKEPESTVRVDVDVDLL